MQPYDAQHFDVESSVPPSTTLLEWQHEHAPTKTQGHIVLVVLAIFHRNTVR